MDGLHHHRCPDCDTIWKHTLASANNDLYHHCPECGAESARRLRMTDFTPAELARAVFHGVREREEYGL